MFGIGCYYADTFTYNTDILVKNSLSTTQLEVLYVT